MSLKSIPLFYFICCGLLIMSCNTPAPVKEQKTDNNVLADFSAHVKDGDLVLRLGNDITSNMLAQLNLKDKRFSHIGICFMENGTKMVYHSVGSEYGSNNFLRKDSLQVFFDLANNLSVGYAGMGLGPDATKRIHDTLEQWYQRKIPFDLDFDWQNDEKMYCSEMAAKAIMRGSGSVSIPITDTLGRQYYSIDNILNALAIDTLSYYSRSLRKL